MKRFSVSAMSVRENPTNAEKTRRRLQRNLVFSCELWIAIAVLFLTSAGIANAADSARAEQLFLICSACHGEQGHGKQFGTIRFPAIAGLYSWYVEAQLQNFHPNQSIRGAHAQDTKGLMMRPMTRTLPTDEDIKAVARYISELPHKPSQTTITHTVTLNNGTSYSGLLKSDSDELTILLPENGTVRVKKSEVASQGAVDLEEGKYFYSQICASCHGQEFQGNPDPTIRAPSHKPLDDWYMLEQLKKFREGIRGSHSKDAGGAKMGPIARDVLPDVASQRGLTPEQAMANVVAYIYANRNK